MNKEQKRKLRNISLLALVGLIGGTFAFTAFNQQAINDRLRENEVDVGGRVHDYYNRDTENKDVFVENYGQEPIMARIRLSEFMEIQGRGQSSFEPVVPDTERETLSTWTTYIPSAGSIGTRTGAGAAFNQYSNLTFGWTRGGQTAPWYLPTFNHNDEDLRTAAAGDARDYLEEGATHPGDGTDAYWSEGESHDNSTGTWPGSMVTRETAQNLSQDRAPITLQTWAGLEEEEQIGNFWVIDHETGWAYWANQLNGGRATSYLLDAAEMTPAADAINGSYYYGIHVDSQLISPDREFEDEAGASSNLSDLLASIRNDGDGNPSPAADAPVHAFDFNVMSSGRIFTMAGEQYRYLEDMGEGNHMIIKNDGSASTGFGASVEMHAHQDWYDTLDDTVKSIVQPVANPLMTNVFDARGLTWEQKDGNDWIPTNLEDFSTQAEDLTVVSPEGRRGAFSLSLADVTHLSQNGAFSNLADRTTSSSASWWLRTGGNPGQMGPPSHFLITNTGGIITSYPAVFAFRPALIINTEK
ncbi:hypothetical protein [Lactococcus formosensis]|uniref:hypothetical protein n=1 Tax=Lactococcus formosensis TaxID=1281486 RepID=UPI001BCDE8A4|nr:hypothetical protein [Lactococcus formosensis]